jgi:hypothetical protein
MKLSRRTFLHLATGAAALPAVSRVARAQAYPILPGLARRRREMIEFLIQMPTATMVFLASAVLSLAATLIVLSR